MLSRVANSVYWMARYIERAENVARFIHVNQHLMLDLPLDEADQWDPLVSVTGDEADFAARYGEPTAQDVIHFLSFDPLNPNSIYTCICNARENARTIRETISSEMWEQINQMYLMVRAAAGAETPEATDQFYSSVKTASHLFEGLSAATMSHNEAWHFLRLGRLCERADKTARIVDVKYFMLLPHVDYVGMPYDTILWSALLKSASAYEMYHKRYHKVQPLQVAEYLILDRDFPRSVYACLTLAEHSLATISGSPPNTITNIAERRMGRLRAELGYAQIDEITTAGLHEYLDQLQAKLNSVGDAIFETFFDLRPVTAAA